ncbi:MAG: transglutaminase-like domain-containing protein [Candidatus Melainabacteria bacterium]|jgi:hypothetical protein
MKAQEKGQKGKMQISTKLLVSSLFVLLLALPTFIFICKVASKPEMQRLDRIKLDYSLTEEELFGKLKKSIPSLEGGEFKSWIAENRFDKESIDGKVFFLNSAVKNLFYRWPELGKRRIDLEDKTEIHKKLLNYIRLIKQTSQQENKHYVLPRRLLAEVEVKVKKNDDTPIFEGELIRAWLPIPRKYPYQNNFELISASPNPKNIDSETNTIRSIYFEDFANKLENQDTMNNLSSKPKGSEGPKNIAEFYAKYTYETKSVYFDLKDLKGNHQPAISKERFQKYTAEESQIEFSEKIKNLSSQLISSQDGDLIKAKKFYKWIISNLQYSHVPEYSTMNNISERLLEKGYGDCGQLSMLFITLCRYNQIPARWQSGWLLIPGWTTIHDWAEIYIEPFGWIPVEPYMGLFAKKYMPSLTDSEREEIADFYFGGLDSYRMIANAGHNEKLEPMKKHARSDSLDFQRAELETENQNIYFNEFQYDLKVQEI